VTKTFPGDNYTERLRNLKVLGFNSYRDYLRGRLWASVRAAALARNGGRCRGCGRPARQVHHQDYSPETLLGQRPHRLIPVCRRCHERIEFDEGGKKRPLREARAVADRLTSSRQRELFG
jgi:5-methylcytosine-specific restriction endonuclease McrA